MNTMTDYTYYRNYTLEKHLKLLSEADKDYELLYSIWWLNKQNLSQGLNVISNIFPHYSKHDISHSMTIVNNIQRILGEERIKRLGATETFLILMACLTHDIGMVLTYNMIEKEWTKNGFQERLSQFTNSNDSIIASNAKVLLNIKNDKNITTSNFEWALKVKNAVIVLTSELLRNKHAQQGADNILTNEEFRKLADNYYSEQLPNRFIELLADVARLHGESFDNVISQLHHKADGYNGDYIHPRFIACMIRLGDLLDFDDNRFNDFSIATIKEMPETSTMHKQKHNAVRHMLISPTKIEADLDCQDENVYRTARSWFDWLEEEASNLCREWPNIVPQDLGGLPPIISKECIRILYKGIETSPELLNLKFTMPQKKIFHILQGGGIYREPGLAFIREIVQNAFDASKIQMWNDLTAGNYNIKIDSNSFPDEVTPDIYRLYPINLRIRLNDEKDTLHIECEDKGTGISEAVLLRMTKFVGDSHQGDDGYAEIYKNMPFWLKPTAAFGIGLQSVFFVANTFEVETKFVGEKSKRIIFRSAADNQYCSIVEENIPRGRGTTIKVDIKKDKFPELFRSYWSIDFLESSSDLENGSDDLYFAIIDDFVTKTFGSIKNLYFSYSTINSEHNFQTNHNTESPQIKPSITNDYKYSYRYDGNLLIFDFYEKKIGSSFSVCFENKIASFKHKRSKLLLRDVIISNAELYMPETRYLRYEWNLNNQTTDSIVDLSRDNLTSEGRQRISDNMLNTLLPETLEIINNIFIKELNSRHKNTNDLKIQYLNCCLTALACGKNDIIKSFPSITLPDHIASNNKGRKIKVKELFNSKTLLWVHRNKINTIEDNDSQKIESITSNYAKILSNNIIIWDDNYLYAALLRYFHCTDILVYDDDCYILKLEKIDSEQNSPKPIKSCKEYLYTLDDVGFPGNVRQAIYGLAQYPYLSVKKGVLPCFNSVTFSSCCIYSPFRNKEEINDLIEEVKHFDSDRDIEEFISSHIYKYITPNLINVIKQHSINPNVTEENIKKDYISLIYDYVKLKIEAK